MDPNELRMYILLNSDVKMSPGKAVAQAGHVISKVTEIMILRYPDKWREYTKAQIHAKIALKCPQAIMEDLISGYSDMSKNQWCKHVQDAGRTQLEPGTLTAIAFCPLLSTQVPEALKNLKLY